MNVNNKVSGVCFVYADALTGCCIWNSAIYVNVVHDKNSVIRSKWYSTTKPDTFPKQWYTKTQSLYANAVGMSRVYKHI